MQYNKKVHVVPDFRHGENVHCDREIFLPLKLRHFFSHNISNQRTDSPESRLEGNGLEVFIPFLSNLLKVFKIQNNLTIRQYYMQKYF